MLSFVTLPDATTILTGIGNYASPLFDNLLPLAMLMLGCIIGGMLVRFIIDIVVSALSWLLGKEESEERLPVHYKRSVIIGESREY